MTPEQKRDAKIAVVNMNKTFLVKLSKEIHFVPPENCNTCGDFDDEKIIFDYFHWAHMEKLFD